MSAVCVAYRLCCRQRFPTCMSDCCPHLYLTVVTVYAGYAAGSRPGCWRCCIRRKARDRDGYEDEGRAAPAKLLQGATRFQKRASKGFVCMVNLVTQLYAAVQRCAFSLCGVTQLREGKEA